MLVEEPPQQLHPSPHAPQGAAAPVPTTYSGGTLWVAVVIALILLGVMVVVFLRTHHHQTEARHALEADVRAAAEAPTAVDAVRVIAAAPEISLKLPGEARAFNDTVVCARVSGYISWWYVDIGDHVEEGEVLAKIDTPELDDQLVAAKAKLHELDSQAHVAEAAANFAKVSFDRWEALTPQGAVAPQARDEKKAELESDLAKLEAAKASVEVGRAEVQRFTTLTGFKEVRAPFEGVITRRDIDIGALITAGSNTSTPLFAVSQSDQIRVIVQVPEMDVPYLKVGMPVTAAAREFPGRTFSGRLDRTDLSVNTMSKMLTAEVLVPNADLTLLPGMYLQVSFQSMRAQPPVRVPAGALCFRPGGAQVAIVQADGKLAFHDVKISRDMGDFVELESGVSPNDEVVLNVGSDLNTGDVVDAHLLVDGIPGTAAPPAGGSHGGAVAATPQPSASAQPEADARAIDHTPPAKPAPLRPLEPRH